MRVCVQPAELLERIYRAFKLADCLGRTPVEQPRFPAASILGLLWLLKQRKQLLVIRR